MIKFEYSYLNLELMSLNAIAGFNISFGNDPDWDDVVVALETRGRKFEDHTSFYVTKEWIDKVCSFIEKQTQLRPLSSWILKTENHCTEHRFAIETDTWYREINLYNLGTLKGYAHPEFKKDELVLIEFFKKIQEFLKEIGIDLEYDRVNKTER